MGPAQTVLVAVHYLLVLGGKSSGMADAGRPEAAHEPDTEIRGRPGAQTRVRAITELSPLDTTSLRDRARRSIRASIVTGEIESGQIYPIAHFSSKLGVSATPIREALFDLAGAGIVEIVRNRGFRVPALTDRDLDEILDLRLLLERTAVVRVAENEGVSNPRKLRRLAAEILADAQKRDIQGFLSADRHFHGELIRRSGNKRLASIVTDLRDQQRLYGLPHLAESGRLLASAREHTEILAAIERRDGAKVYRLMTQHLLHTRGAWAGREEAALSSEVISRETTDNMLLALSGHRLDVDRPTPRSRSL